ncbi:MAG: ferrochelatase [Bacteroidales bacterium]|nr:ferrochelatase [Bacteroidales bacterium]
MNNKTAVLIINLGTPDKPSRKAVAKFLSEFLGDGRVIDLPYLFRKLLVNIIIVPFRAGKSAEMYRRLWTKKGSPILYNTHKLKVKLQNQLQDKYEVFMAMRYGNPSMNKILFEIEKKQFNKLIIIPLFPQYASSTSGTIIEKALKIIRRWNYIPELKVMSEFYRHPLFIKSWVEHIKQANFEDYEHILFSFHGLPERHVKKTHEDKPCTEMNCKTELNAANHACYRAQCYEHTRLIAKELGLSAGKYTVCFQSRFGKDWLAPFTEDEVIKHAQKGTKKLLVVPLSFVADCLETIVEIGVEYHDLFIEKGGEKLEMVQSLNDADIWVGTLAELIEH